VVVVVVEALGSTVAAVAVVETLEGTVVVLPVVPSDDASAVPPPDTRPLAPAGTVVVVVVASCARPLAVALDARNPLRAVETVTVETPDAARPETVTFPLD